MTTMTLPAEIPPKVDSEWDDSKIMSSLARLQEMHAQLRHLRDTFPRLVDPMLVQQSSPENLYATFSSSVGTTTTDVKNFTRLINDARSRDILKRAKESRAENSDSIIGWDPTEHEDWLEVHGGDSPGDITMGDTQDIQQESDSHTVEGLRAALQKFQLNHPGIQTSLDENNRCFKMALPPPFRIHFEISTKATPDNPSMFEVICAEKGASETSIVRSINTRPKPNDPIQILVG
ncbi:MAG: hypothetical protein Q9167_001792 [Letrouitia subvulpina]